MAVLGKRKTRNNDVEPAISAEQAQAIFRKHFEMQFAPLAGTEAEGVNGDNSEENTQSQEDSDEPEWGGFSEAEDQPEEGDHELAPQIIDHTTGSSSVRLAATIMSKSDRRRFLSGIPTTAPSYKHPLPATAPPASTDDLSDPEDAAAMLAQDLELQRLLRESHLFSSLNTHTSTASTPFADRRARSRATDLRMNALGAKAVLSGAAAQKKMPMAQRKGIAAAAVGREEKRRREARDNGIVLERFGGGKEGLATAGEKGKGKRKRKSQREMAVDMPAVGKMRGAELRLSRKDVREIEGGSSGIGRRRRG